MERMIKWNRTYRNRMIKRKRTNKNSMIKRNRTNRNRLIKRKEGNWANEKIVKKSSGHLFHLFIARSISVDKIQYNRSASFIL